MLRMFIKKLWWQKSIIKQENNVYQNQLNFILDFENSLYKRINEHNVEEYKEYLEKICPDITLDILNDLF